MIQGEPFDKNQNPSSGDPLLISGSALFFIFLLFQKFEKWFLVWLESTTHKLALVLLLGLLLLLSMDWIVRKFRKGAENKKRDFEILGPAEGAVFCGVTATNEKVFIKPRQRAMHTQVIGTTNAGKTESVILPWAIQDIQQGRGLILIDGKSDRGLLDKLWAYTKAAGRERDFRLVSLSHINESSQFNPLLGGSPEEISERVFNAFEFENPYYRSIQFEVFSQMMRVFSAIGIVPTFLRLYQAIATPKSLQSSLEKVTDEALKAWLRGYIDLPPNERLQRTSGLTAAMSHFAFGQTSVLFNTEQPVVNLDQALSKNQIIYFQLPVLLSPFLGKATGKMVLQALQSAVGNRHRNKELNPKFFSVFLDDFTEYLYPGFVSVLNKSRSANVGVVFAHQALGDIQTLGDAIANSILTNANIKVFMRGNDPESAEYFSRVIGTVKSVKYTERTRRNLFHPQSTGDASAREVDEFIVHPNHFKSELGVGEAVMVVPHERGSTTATIKFRKFDDLDALPMEVPLRSVAQGLVVPSAEIEDSKDQPAKRTEHKNPYEKEAT